MYMAQSVVRSRRGSATAAEPYCLQRHQEEDSFTPYSASGSQSVMRSHVARRDRDETLRRVYRSQLVLPRARHKVEPCSESRSHFLHLYTMSKAKTKTKPSSTNRSYSCARSAYQRAGAFHDSEWELLHGKRMSCTNSGSDYSGTPANWKRTNSAEFAAQSGRLGQCASIPMRGHAERHKKCGGSLDLSPNPNAGSSANLSTAAGRMNSSSIVPQASDTEGGESVEEIHYFFVKFQQRAKKMLRRVEAVEVGERKERVLSSKEGSEKSIVTVPEEDEDEVV